jgi:transposase
MSKYYSLDLRRLVPAYCVKHGSGKTAEAFSIGRATAVRWADKFRRTGDVAIGKVGGRRRPVLGTHEDWLRERMAAETHLSLRRLQAELAERGIVVSYGAIWTTVHRLGLSFKKSLYAEEATRPDIARKRRWWQRIQARIEVSRLVFIDETPAFAGAGSGSRPTWHPCTVGAGGARDFGPVCLMDTGRH